MVHKKMRNGTCVIVYKNGVSHTEIRFCTQKHEKEKVHNCPEVVHFNLYTKKGIHTYKLGTSTHDNTWVVWTNLGNMRNYIRTTT